MIKTAIRKKISIRFKLFLLTGSSPSPLERGWGEVRKQLVHFFWLLLFIGNSAVHAQNNAVQYSLIPYPVSLSAAPGHFSITPATLIVAPANAVFKNEATILSHLFTNSFGAPLKQSTTAKGATIQLVHDASQTATEGYRLTVTSQQVTLSAGSPAGMFMAIQTIRQLLPASIEKKNIVLQKNLSLPAITIKDEPAYSWRGMHLDVSRHFFSMDYLKKLIDLMSLYKLNKFHLHLTDDQGWRIEIKKYPKLTEEGAWRTFNNQDSSCIARSKENPDFAIDPRHIIQKNGKTLYGGFYTQKQMKDLVAYAAARHIDIIPEIDMPGHMMAAINAYKYLSCDGNSVFGELFSSPICPCFPSTFQFAQDVFTEIMDIFPSQYIHIGGDEVDRSYWAKSDECKALMAKEGLKNTEELQSYFIRKMEAFFNSKGRKLIGWDEILEGGISKTAMIMYWRVWVPKAPVHAVKNGNKVIMATGNPLYFSQPADKNSLPDVYHFSAIPQGLTNEESKNIMGAQGNLWTERVPTEQRADYLIMPRLTALAEKLWTNHADYKFYLQRLTTQYTRLDKMQVNYRLPDLPLLENYAFTDKTTLEINKPLPDLVIRYTTDSTLPGMHSKILSAPLTISQSQTVRLAAFKEDGRRGDVYDLHYRKQNLAEPETLASTANGLTCTWYKKSFNNTTFISQTKPDGSTNVQGVIIPKEAVAPSFALQYRGYINAPEDGIYSFYLTSDDGSVLRIAGREVVNNDDMHAPKEKNGQVALKKGLHKFEIDFVEGGGGYTLKLQYSKDGSEPLDIPDSWFKN